MTFHLPATYYDPPEPGPMTECPDCGGHGCHTEEPMDWWHGSGVNAVEVTCQRCCGEGEIPAMEHPDWCDRCGLAGNCPECDPKDPHDD